MWWPHASLGNKIRNGFSSFIHFLEFGSSKYRFKISQILIMAILFLKHGILEQYLNSAFHAVEKSEPNCQPD